MLATRMNAYNKPLVTEDIPARDQPENHHMHSPFRILTAALVFAITWLSGTPIMNAAETINSAETNKQLVQSAFDRWRAGTGGPFELLTDDATWTITGNSIVAKKYATRDKFIDTVIKPFNARLT